jgi:hypothetical protein
VRKGVRLRLGALFAQVLGLGGGGGGGHVVRGRVVSGPMSADSRNRHARNIWGGRPRFIEEDSSKGLSAAKIAWVAPPRITANNIRLAFQDVSQRRPMSVSAHHTILFT